MKCNSTKHKVMLLIAESRLFCYELTVGTYRLEIIAEKKEVDVVLAPVLGHSLSALGIALSRLRRGGEAPQSDMCWKSCW